MIQKPIKLRQNQAQRFEIEEMDANLAELNARTQSPKQGYNSIAELGTRLVDLEQRQEPTAIENEYLTIPALLAGQFQQTAGQLQYVEDAAGDPNAPAGYAYYEKMTASTGSLSDYRLLTPAETQVINTGVQKVKDSYGTQLEARLAVEYGPAFRVEQAVGGGYRVRFVPEGVDDVKQFTKTANYILDPLEVNGTIINEGKVCTFDSKNKVYPAKYQVAMANDAQADTSIVLIGNDGWSYSLNGAAYENLANGTNKTLTWLAGGTCTLIRKGSTNKILIHGGVE